MEQKDILQINATLIAGALIFLTVLTTTGHGIFDVLNRLIASIVGLLVIAVSSYSSFQALENNTKLAMNIMKYGFFVLFIISLVILIPLMLIGAQETVRVAREGLFNITNGTALR